MAPALEPYTLATVVAELKEEFGNPVDPSGAFDAMVRRKVNHAIQRLWTSRPFWHYSVHPLALNVQAPIVCTGATLTQGSAAVSWTAPAVPTSPGVRRWTLQASTGGQATEEYLVKAHPTTLTLTLDQPYVGATLPGTGTFTLRHSFVQLPADLSHVHRLRTSLNLRSPLTAREPWHFDRLLAQSIMAGSGIVSHYAVVPDPLSDPVTGTVDTEGKWVTLWPRPEALQRLDGWYFSSPFNLQADGDLMPVPHGYRLIAFYVAARLIAVARRDFETGTFYDREAQEVVANLKKAARYEDDDDTELQEDPEDPLGPEPPALSVTP